MDANDAVVVVAVSTRAGAGVGVAEVVAGDDCAAVDGTGADGICSFLGSGFANVHVDVVYMLGHLETQMKGHCPDSGGPLLTALVLGICTYLLPQLDCL